MLAITAFDLPASSPKSPSGTTRGNCNVEKIPPIVVEAWAIRYLNLNPEFVHSQPGVITAYEEMSLPCSSSRHPVDDPFHDEIPDEYL